MATTLSYNVLYVQDVELAGFSKASDDMSRAKGDCRRIFETVQEYLGALAAGLP